MDYQELLEELECSICNDLFVNATNLNCSHTFCEACLSSWFRTNKNCPMCRTAVTTKTRSLVLDNYLNKLRNKLKEPNQPRRSAVSVATQTTGAQPRTTVPDSIAAIPISAPVPVHSRLGVRPATSKQQRSAVSTHSVPVLPVPLPVHSRLGVRPATSQQQRSAVSTHSVPVLPVPLPVHSRLGVRLDDAVECYDEFFDERGCYNEEDDYFYGEHDGYDEEGGDFDEEGADFDGEGDDYDGEGSDCNGEGDDEEGDDYNEECDAYNEEGNECNEEGDDCNEEGDDCNDGDGNEEGDDYNEEGDGCNEVGYVEEVEYDACEDDNADGEIEYGACENGDLDYDDCFGEVEVDADECGYW